MADIRIKDLPTTATQTASDDFIALDGTVNGTRKIDASAPSFKTSVTSPSIVAPAATALTLAGGTSGASLVLGQGTTAGAATLASTGTGNAKVGFSAASGAYASLGVSSASATDGPFILVRGKDEPSSEGWVQIVTNSSNAGVSSGSLQVNQYNGTSFNEVLRTTKLRNLLIGTTTDIAGTGGLHVAGTATASTITSGALRVGSNVGLSGNAGGASYFGGSGAFGPAFTPLAWGSTAVDINSTTGGLLAVYYGGTAKGYLAAQTDGILLQTQSNGTVRINTSGAGATTLGNASGGVSVPGAATFGGAVTATSGAATSNPILTLHNSNTGASNYGISLTNANPDAGSRNWAIVTNNAAFGDFSILQSNAIGGNPLSAGTARLSLTGTAATFAGIIKPQQATTAGAPAYVKGAIYFDTTLNKLRVGGATAWETITSV